jgi:hypothetical protein
MILGMEIGMFIMGVYALATGRMTLWRNRVVHGPVARFLGLVAMAPVPLTVLLAVGPRALVTRHDPSHRWHLVALEVGAISLCIVVIYVLGILWSGLGTTTTGEAEQNAFRRAYPGQFGGSPLSIEGLQQPQKRRSPLTAMSFLLLGLAIAAGVVAGLGISRPAASTRETKPPGDPDRHGDQYDAADPPEQVPDGVDARLLSPGAKIYLSNLQEFAWKAGAPGWRFGKAGDLGAPGEPRLIQFHSQKTTRSLSMHPPDRGYTRVCYYLGRRAQVLRATTGLSDDEPQQTPQPTRFLVLGDGKLLWQSGIHGDSNSSSVIDLDVSRVNVLELRTHVMAASSTGSHAVWLQPYVVTKGATKGPHAPRAKKGNAVN